MSSRSAPKTDIVDELDAGIMHGLQVAPRAPFAVLGEVLGVSEQTVARRYRRLRSDGILRVIGLLNPAQIGLTHWGLRLKCQPNAAAEIAQALARRDDIGWVALLSGGSEIAASVRARTAADRDRLLMELLPRTAQVLSIDAFAYLHIFRGSSTRDWRVGSTLLDKEQELLLQGGQISVDGHEETLRADDEPLLREIFRDGRATFTTLATATGWSESRAARRFQQLVSAGVVYFDVDFSMAAFGLNLQAYLQLIVEPSRLSEVGERLAGHDRVMFAAATTGSTSMAASVACGATEELFRFVSDDIGQMPGVSQVQIAPITRTVKQAGSLLDGDRLATPVPF